MPEQVLLPVERLVALVALERPHALVQFHVLRQVLFPLKLLLANVTRRLQLLLHADLDGQRILILRQGIDRLQGNYLWLGHRHRLHSLRLWPGDHLHRFVAHDERPLALRPLGNLRRAVVACRLHKDWGRLARIGHHRLRDVFHWPSPRSPLLFQQ